MVSPPEFEAPEEAPDELVRTVLEEGDPDGRVAQRFDTVDVHLIGVLIDDETVLASTFGTGDPIALTIGRADPRCGPRRRARGVRPGDVVQLDIPADEAFGEAGNQPTRSARHRDDVRRRGRRRHRTPPRRSPRGGPDRAHRDRAGARHRRAGGRGRHGVGQLHRAVLSEDGTRFATNYQEQPYPVDHRCWRRDPGLGGRPRRSNHRVADPDRHAGGRGYQRRRVPSESIPEDAAISFLSTSSPSPRRPMKRTRRPILELPITEEPLNEVVVDDVTVGDGEELTTGLTGYADVYLVCATTARSSTTPGVPRTGSSCRCRRDS